VNTVHRVNGKLVGSNTDADGGLDALERVAQVRGRRILLLGAGGAARALAFEASQRGAHVTIANRTASKAKKLAKEFRMSWVRMEELKELACDIIINTTSIGMIPDVHATPLPGPLLKDKIVFDIVYNPPETQLLKEAQARGARTVSGVEMYLNQAALQAERYTGIRPRTTTMRRVMNSWKEEKE
jgi:shikimate dehydrogenase